MSETVNAANQPRVLHGRKKIFVTGEINEENIISILNELLRHHIENAKDEDYLYWYRKGKQPILHRTKEIRPEICNKVVINNASSVVNFKNGYFLTKPAAYVSLSEEANDKVSEYNKYVRLSGKNIVDNKVADWFHTVGIGTIFVEPNKGFDKAKSPFKVYSLDPRFSFVAYDLTPAQMPCVGVNVVIQETDIAIIDVYTKDKYYKLLGKWGGNLNNGLSFLGATAEVLLETRNNVLGQIPIIEYRYNYTGTSAFEPALSIMDEINNMESNRADSVEQAVQQLCVAYNCQFEDGENANTIRQAGMITLNSTNENKADFKILESQVNQTDTQTTIDNLYQQMLDKCGVPSSIRDGGSTSDNVGAVYLRNGWAMADTDARNTTDLFIEANALFDEVALTILKLSIGFELSPADFELKIERNSTSNLIAKTQAAMNMQKLGLAPEIWLERSGLSNDPLTDIARSEKYLVAVNIEQPKEVVVSNENV